MFLGILTLVTALSISAVAIYYSVAGLMTIFAAAAVPIMIMGGALEIGKLVTAVWLHRYWKEATWWLKSYLTLAVLVLMFITSMGIFGFLSKAHIEQTASAAEGVAQIERINTEIGRQQDIIARAEQRIEDARNADNSRDEELQQQIAQELERVDSAYARIQPAIDEQLAVIESETVRTNTRVAPIQAEVDSITTVLNDLQTAINSGDIERAQGIVGTAVDGDYGPNTARAVEAFRAAQLERRDNLVAQIDRIKTEPNSIADDARTEIQRLRSLAEQQIADSNLLIERLRSQLGQGDAVEVETLVEEQLARIAQANNSIDTLTDQRYSLEADYRALEAEVGPVKYIAEFIYGEDADKNLLEEAVRWVILIIIFVFDPLAVLLLIASQHTFILHRAAKNKAVPEVVDTVEETVVTTDDNDTTKSAPSEIAEVSIPIEESIEQKKSLELSEELKQARAEELEAQENDVNYTEAKRAWKEEHPDLTIKEFKQKYVDGVIDVLPWEEYLESKKKTYMIKEGLDQIKKTTTT